VVAILSYNSKALWYLTRGFGIVATLEPAGDGRVDLTNSQAFIGALSSPRLLDGHVTTLSGPSLPAELEDAGGRSYTAQLRLNVSSGSDQVTVSS
jgi:hypothetical protein